MIYAVISVAILLVGFLLIRAKRPGYTGWFVYVNSANPAIDWVEMQGLAKPFRIVSLYTGEHSMSSYHPWFPHVLPESVTVRWQDSEQSEIKEYRVTLPSEARKSRDGMLLIVRRECDVWDVSFHDQLDLAILHEFQEKIGEQVSGGNGDKLP